MGTIILWVSILVLIAVVALGFLIGHRRGVKRAGVHIAFVIIAFVLAIFLAKVITNGILGIQIQYNGETMTLTQVIVDMISEIYDFSNYTSLQTFLTYIPAAIVTPLVYMGMVIAILGVCEGIYHLVVRFAFGKKKESFQKEKPRRWWGAAIGAVEAFLFMFLFLAPISSLSGLYSSLAESENTVQAEETTSTSSLQTISEMLNDLIPAEVNEAIIGYDNSAFAGICKMFGFDDLIYDYFSEFEIDGEKVVIRKEIQSIAVVYDDFVVVYNTLVDSNFDFSTDTVDLSSLKSSLEYLMDNALFKTVVCDSVVTFVCEYDLEENSLSFPDIALDIVESLQGTFNEESFDGQTYLKENLLSVVDVAANVFDNNLIGKFKDIEEVTLTSILEYVSDNSEPIREVVNGAFSIDIVETCFPALCDYASTYLSDYFEESNTEGLTIALNSDISDSAALIDDLLAVVNDLLDLNEEVELATLLEGDLTSSISADADTDTLLTKLGTTLDKLRELEIFVLEETPGEMTYVLDNILSVMGVEILGDTVTQGEEEVTLDTYTKFCDYLKTPVKNAQSLGFFDEGDYDFDKIIDNLLAEVTADSTFLSETIMPFYQLSVLSLKETVFDSVVELLTSNTSRLIDFDDTIDSQELTTAQKYSAWKSQFDELESILNLLNRGSVGEDELTYIKYVLSENFTLDTLMDSLRTGVYTEEQSDLNAILSKIFVSDLTKSLTKQVFDYIDEAVGDVTKVTPTTFSTTSDISITETNVANIVSIIESLLDETDKLESELDLQTVGKIIDMLKEEAYNSGSKNGVFNSIFCNLVWYMTGDVLDGLNYSGYTPYEDYEYVKAYLDVADINTYEGYYTLSYTDKFAELEDVVALVDALSTKNITSEEISFTDKTAEEVATYLENLMSSFKEALASVDTDLTNQATIVKNLTTLLTNMEDPLISSSDVDTYGTAIDTAVFNAFDDNDGDSTDAESVLTARIQTLLKLKISE